MLKCGINPVITVDLGGLYRVSVMSQLLDKLPESTTSKGNLKAKAVQ